LGSTGIADTIRPRPASAWPIPPSLEGAMTRTPAPEAPLRTTIIKDEIDDFRVIIAPKRDVGEIGRVAGPLLGLLCFFLLIVIVTFVDGARRDPDRASRDRTIALAVFGPFFLLIAGFLAPPLVFTIATEEVVSIDGKRLALTVRPIRYRKPETCPLSAIRNLRYAPVLEDQVRRGEIGNSPWTQMFYRPVIAFNCGGKTVRFGHKLPETEARRLVATLKRHFAIPDDKDEPIPLRS
jgi:hypothetical protein